MIIMNKFKLQMLRLLFLLQLCTLALSACNYNPVVEGITTYSLKLASKGQNSQQYPLPINSNLSSSYALAIRSLEWKGVSSWNITLGTKNQTSIAILLQTNNHQWTSISCILWSITSSLIFGGFGKVQLQDTNTSARSIITHLGVNRPIIYQSESVAVVFVVGVGLRSVKLAELRVLPFRVYNSSIFLNITGSNISEIQSIHLNFVIFSPNRVNFQAFGSIIQIPQNVNIQYLDIAATVPPTQYMIYGIVALANTPDLHVDISANDYLLAAISPKTPVSISYLYVTPQQIQCGDCPFKVIYQGQCLAECPKNTYLVQFGGVRFCRGCSKELNLQLQPEGKGCVCLEGYVMKDQKCVKNFIPISLLVGLSKDMKVSSAVDNQFLANQTTIKQILPENLTKQSTIKPIQQHSQQNHVFLPLQLIANKINLTSDNSSNQQDVNQSVALRNSSLVQVSLSKTNSSEYSKNQTINNDNDTLQGNNVDQSLFEDDPQDYNLTMDSNKISQVRRSLSNRTDQIKDNNTLLNNNSSKPLMIILDKAPHLKMSTESNTTALENQNKTTNIQILKVDSVLAANLQKPIQSTQVSQNTTNSSLISNNRSISASNIEIGTSFRTANNQSNATTNRIPQVPSLIIISPLTVTTGLNNGSNNTIDCSLSLNTIAVNGKCVCKLGYINISSICTPLSELLIASNTPKTVKATEACPSNQVYSTELQRCTCREGQKMSNQSQCVSQCSQDEDYYFKQKDCVCKAGLARINGVCTKCQKLTTGKQQCYPFQVPLVCRVGHIQSQSYCIKCSSIAIQPNNTQICNICQGGFTYDGRRCICPAASTQQNGTCFRNSCGNGQIQQGQLCDDGNKANGDGCSSQCLIESGFFCKNASEACVKAVCGDGAVNGGELCDDGNLASGDGCSSTCLIQTNVTCVGVPSACFFGESGNLSLTNIYTNTNNVFVQLNTGWIVNLQAPILASTFFRIRFLNGSQVGTPYCQGGSQSDQFSCLIIYPQGVPVVRNFVRFSYSWQGKTGSLIIELGPSRWQFPLVSRRQ